MKISTSKLRKLIQEELFYREFYNKKDLKEFWGKKKSTQQSPPDWKNPLGTASEKMHEVVSALWGLHDNPPRPDLLQKAIKLMEELDAAASEEK